MSESYHSDPTCQTISQANLSSATALIMDDTPMEVYLPIEHPFEFSKATIEQANTITLSKRLVALIKAIGHVTLFGGMKECIASQEYIGKNLVPQHGWKAMTRDTVCRAVSELKKLGLVVAQKRHTKCPTFSSRKLELTLLGWTLYFKETNDLGLGVDNLETSVDKLSDYSSVSEKTPYYDLKNPTHIIFNSYSSSSEIFNNNLETPLSVDNLDEEGQKFADEVYRKLAFPIEKEVYFGKRLNLDARGQDMSELNYAIECIKLRLEQRHHEKAIKWVRTTTAKSWQIYSILETVSEFAQEHAIQDIVRLLDYQHRRLMTIGYDDPRPLYKTKPVAVDEAFVKAPIPTHRIQENEPVKKLGSSMSTLFDDLDTATKEQKQKAADLTVEHMQKIGIDYSQRNFDSIFKVKLKGIMENERR